MECHILKQDGFYNTMEVILGGGGVEGGWGGIKFHNFQAWISQIMIVNKNLACEVYHTELKYTTIVLATVAVMLDKQATI